jgi:hypothetical protein
MLHRMLFTVALTLLLGFSQHTALVHGITHIADIDATSNHLAEKQADQTSHAANHCDQCLSFSHLAGIIHSSHVLAFATVPHVAPDPLLFASRYHLVSSVYSARAPPILI